MFVGHKFPQPLLIVFLSLFLLSCGGSGSSKQEPPVVLVEPLISQFSFLAQNNPSLSSDLSLSISALLILKIIKI